VQSEFHTCSTITKEPGQRNTSLPSWCAKSGAMLGLRSVGTSLLSRFRPMWLLVVFTCERTCLGKKIWVRRRYQHCCHCLFKASVRGQKQSCNWSFTT
jgi:hypothetical protein